MHADNWSTDMLYSLVISSPVVLFIAWAISHSRISLLPIYGKASLLTCLLNSIWFLMMTSFKESFSLQALQKKFPADSECLVRNYLHPLWWCYWLWVSWACRLLLLYSDIMTDCTIPGKIRWIRRSEMAEKGLDITSPLVPLLIVVAWTLDLSLRLH